MMPFTSEMLCTSIMGDEAMAKCNVITSTIWMLFAPLVMKQWHSKVAYALVQY